MKAKLRAGVCRICKCTHTTPCADGCAWVDRQQTLCSACDDHIDAGLAFFQEHGLAALRRLTIEVIRCGRRGR